MIFELTVNKINNLIKNHNTRWYEIKYLKNVHKASLTMDNLGSVYTSHFTRVELKWI